MKKHRQGTEPKEVLSLVDNYNIAKQKRKSIVVPQGENMSKNKQKNNTQTKTTWRKVCPQNWRRVKLGEIMKTARVDFKKVKTSEYKRTGRLPIFDQGSDAIAGYTDNPKAEYRGKSPAILFGDHTLKLKIAEPPFAIGADGIQILEPDENLLDRKFFYYAIKGLKVRSYGYERHLKYLRELEIVFPSITDQKRIAAILSAFDDKIELNNKISRALEQMAQAIFKEWFIFFRFPGHEKVKMVDSELGKIPEGWEVKELSHLFNFIGGSQPPKSEHIYEEKEGYVRFIQNRDYSSESHKTYIKVSNRNKICNELDILMDKYGEVGMVRFGIAGAYNVALAKLEPKQPYMREFLRFYFWREPMRQMIESTAIASTRGSLNQNTFTGMEVVVPPKDLLGKFNELSENILTKMLQIKVENQKLAALRDLLLPKLMSGEIRV